MRGRAHALMGLLLAGCSAAASPDYYRLQPQDITAANCSRAGAVDVVLPSVAPGLDSAHIAVIDRPQHVSFYQDVAWIDTLPNVLQAYFVDALEQSRSFTGAMAEGGSAAAPLQLSIAVRNFEVDQTAAARVMRVRFSAVLRRGGQVVLRKSLAEEVDVSAESIGGIVQQFNRTLDRLTQQMLQAVQRKTGCR